MVDKKQIVIVVLLMTFLFVPMVSAFQWCDWIPFWKCQDDLNGYTITAQPSLRLVKYQGLEKYIYDNVTTEVNDTHAIITINVNLARWNWAKNAVENPTMAKCYQAEPIIRQDYPNFNCSKASHRTLLKNKLTKFVNNGLKLQVKGKNKGYYQRVGSTVYVTIPKTLLGRFSKIYLGENSIHYEYVAENLEIRNDTNKVVQDITLTYNTEQCLTDCEARGTSVLYQDDELFNGYDFVDKGGSLVNLSNVEFYVGQMETFNNTYDTYDPNCTTEDRGNGTQEYCDPFVNGSVTEYYDEVVYQPYNFETLQNGSYYWKIKARKSPSESVDWAVSLQGFDTSIIRQYWAWWNSPWQYKRLLSNLTGEYPTLNLSWEGEGKMNYNFSDLRFLDGDENFELNYTIRDYDNASWVFVTVDTNNLSGNFTIGAGLPYSQANESIDSIVSSYSFDSGLTKDDTGNYNLTNHGAELVRGKISEGGDFTINIDYVESQVPSMKQNENWSWSLWYNPDSIGTAGKSIIGSGKDFNAFSPIIYRKDADIKWQIQNNGFGNTLLLTGGTVSIGHWTHLVITYNGVTKEMVGYQDGVEVVRGTATATNVNGSDGLIIGGFYNQATPQAGGGGQIDEVIITSDILTQSEVLTLYNNQTLNNTNQIYMYYGNENATTTESFNDTFHQPDFAWTFDAGLNDEVLDIALTPSGAVETQGFIGRAYDFTRGGGDDWLSGTAPADTSWDELCMSAFIDLDQFLGGSVLYSIYDRNNVVTNLAIYALYNTTYFRHSSLTTADTFSTNADVTDNGFYNVVYSYNGTHVAMFVNGTEVVASSQTGTISYASNNIQFGDNPIGTNQGFDGIIDEPYIWQKGCSPEFAQQLSTMSDQTTSYILGGEESQTTPLQNPNVTLIEPTDNTYDTDGNVFFNCTSTHETGITALNMTFDNVTVAEVTNTSNFENLTATYTNASIPDGVYTWECNAVSVNDTNATSSTYTLNVDSNPPIVNLTSPSDSFIVTEANETVYVNWTATDFNLSSCWYNYTFNNGTEQNVYTNVTCGVNESTFYYPASNPDNVTIIFTAKDGFNHTANDSATIYKSTVQPDVTVTAPLSKIEHGYGNIELNLNYSASDNDSSVDSCWYYEDGTLKDGFENGDSGWSTGSRSTVWMSEGGYGFYNEETSIERILTKSGGFEGVKYFYFDYNETGMAGLPFFLVSYRDNGGSWQSVGSSSFIDTVAGIQYDFLINYSGLSDFVVNDTRDIKITYAKNTCFGGGCGTYYGAYLDNFRYYDINDNLLNVRSGNRTLNCSVNTTTFKSSGYDNKSVTVFANDSLGNVGSQSWNWTYYLYQDDETVFNSRVGERTDQSYNLTVHLPDSDSITNAEFVYNGTNYTANIDLNGETAVLSYSLQTPDVDTDTVLFFYWNISINPTIITTLENQTVFAISLDDCSNYTTLVMNFTMIDEGTELILNSSNSTIELDLYLRSVNGSEILQYYDIFENTPYAPVCINELLNDSAYELDTIVSYVAEGYAQEFWYLDDGLLTSDNDSLNSYVEKNTTLRDLDLTDSTTFLFKYYDEFYSVHPNAIVSVLRYYIGEGVYKEAEKCKLDDYGECHLHFVEEDVIYKFRITENGTLEYTSEEYNAKCLETLCQVNLRENNVNSQWDSQGDNLDEGTYSVSSDSDTRTVDLAFNLQSTGTMDLEVYEYDQDSDADTLVGSDTVVAKSGTASVTIAPSYGNQTYYAVVKHDDEFVSSQWVDMNESGFQYFGTLGLFLAGLLILSLGLIAVSSGGWTIVFLILGLLIASITKLVDMDYYLMMYIVSAGGLLVWKLSSRRSI